MSRKESRLSGYVRVDDLPRGTKRAVEELLEKQGLSAAHNYVVSPGGEVFHSIQGGGDTRITTGIRIETVSGGVVAEGPGFKGVATRDGLVAQQVHTQRGDYENMQPGWLNRRRGDKKIQYEHTGRIAVEHRVHGTATSSFPGARGRTLTDFEQAMQRGMRWPEERPKGLGGLLKSLTSGK